jgi:hypothetical protein
LDSTAIAKAVAVLFLQFETMRADPTFGVFASYGSPVFF